jgi:hypothetical protein
MKPSTRRALRFLKDNPQGVTTHDCIQHLTHRFSARFADLRADGYVIETRRHAHTSVCTYHLISEPAPASGSAAASDNRSDGTLRGPTVESAPEATPPASSGRTAAAEPGAGAELFELPEQDLSQARNAALQDWEDEAA